jgi:CubicO group peptidase (beta-lactamase class C family)
VDGVAEEVDRVAVESGFSGVVRIDQDGAIAFAQGYGMADRAHEIPNTIDTQFGLASGGKGFTALAVVRLIEAGTLELATTARSILGPDLPLIDDGVTVEQLLTHTSGIGDYIDEDDEDAEITDYVMPVPVQELATIEQFVKVLDGFPTKFAPGERFSYCNGGFVVLALIAERASGTPYHEQVEQVCARAGLRDTAFLRSDELPGRAATGYLAVDGLRTNVLHLPVRGTGDGGIYSTAADVHLLWSAFLGGRIVSPDWVAEMVRPRNDAPEDHKRYGLGFWLHETTDAVILTGYDAGVSFRSVHGPTSGITYTVISNWSEGAWPIARYLMDAITP